MPKRQSFNEDPEVIDQAEDTSNVELSESAKEEVSEPAQEAPEPTKEACASEEIDPRHPLRLAAIIELERLINTIEHYESSGRILVFRHRARELLAELRNTFA